MSLKLELSLSDIINDFEEFNSAIDDVDEQDSDMAGMATKLLLNLGTINNTCYSSFDTEAKIKIITCITNFKVIMTPNTGLMFRCSNCCAKRKRQKKHDQKCALTTVQLIESVYLVQAYAVKSKCAAMIQECMHSKKFADTLRQISSTTSIFEIKNTLESKASSKEKLSILMSRIELYKEEFLSARSDETRSGVSASATPTRFRNIRVALASNPNTSTSYGSYKKANKMLYDVASFGASLLLFKIDEQLKTLDEYMKILQKARTEEISELDSFELSAFTCNLIDESVLVQTKEYSENIDGDIHGKLVEAASEWSQLKLRVSSESFLSTFFGSADDDIESLFSSVSFMSPSTPSSNINPRTKSCDKESDVTKNTSKNVTEFFNNIKLPHNKKPRDHPEPPIYNLYTKQPIGTSTNNKPIKKYSSEDYLPLSIITQPSSPPSPPPPLSSIEEPQELSPSLSLEVIDFEDSPTGGLLRDTRTSSSSGSGSNSNSSGTSTSNGKINSKFSSKFNSKINQMSGSISRTASKASAIASETKGKVSEKVATSAPRRILKNSYSSLKNKSDGM
jgi:hypothetical protein